jgi:hypothetical protein
VTTRPNAPRPEIDRMIADRIVHHAGQLDVAGRPVAAVMARGRHRQHRRRTAIGIAALAGITGATVASVNVLTGPTDRPVSDDGITSPEIAVDGTTDTALPTTVPPMLPFSSVPATPLELVDSNLVWNVIEPGSAEALGSTLLADTGGIVGDGPYLAWSTAPGKTDSSRPALWRSDDGQRWRLSAASPPVSAVGLAASNGRFLAFGTMPSTAPTSAGRAAEAAVAVSDDAGDSWRTVELPIDLTGFSADPTVRSAGTAAVAIAAGEPGVLVAARTTVNLDWEAILPDDVSDGGWVVQADGVHLSATDPCAPDSVPPTVATTVSMASGAVPLPEVVGATSSTITEPPVGSQSPGSATTVPSERCTASPQPARVLSWDELGVAPATAAALTGDLRFFLATDGEQFEEVSGPPVPAGRTTYNVDLVQHAGGFAAQVLQDDEGTRSQLYTSPDGRTWNDLGATPMIFTGSLAAMGDRFVLAGPTEDSTIVAVRAPTGEWTTINLNGVLRPEDGVKPRVFAMSATVGPTGITVAGSIFKDPVAEVGGVEMTRDGITVRADDSASSYTFLDSASGAELGTIVNGSEPTGLVSMSTAGERIEVRSDDGGPVVATFTWDDLGGLMNEVFEQAEPPQAIVLHSTDGVRWSRESLDDLAGEAVTTSGSRAVGSQVIVAVSRSSTIDGGDSVPEQLLLIGTPKG